MFGRLWRVTLEAVRSTPREYFAPLIAVYYQWFPKKLERSDKSPNNSDELLNESIEEMKQHRVSLSLRSAITSDSPTIDTPGERFIILQEPSITSKEQTIPPPR
jgi:hypothetical protein